MTRSEFENRLRRSDEPLGPHSVVLRVGDDAWAFTGLDADLEKALRRRWGPFVSDVAKSGAIRVEVRDAGVAEWIPTPTSPEVMRMEPVPGTDPPAVVSYSFGLALTPGGSAILGVCRAPRERAERVLENAARILVARRSVEAGGLAFHGAGVERNGRAWIFVGPSGAGKSTAARLSRPAPSLGDDFAVVVPGAEGWRALAVPFDNAEAVPAEAPTGSSPLAAVCRLHKAEVARAERPRGPAAVASLLATAAFPWVLADRAEAMAEAALRLVDDGRFVHLEFADDPAFWDVLETGPRPG